MLHQFYGKSLSCRDTAALTSNQSVSRIVKLVISLLLITGLTACGGASNSNNSTSSNSSSSHTTAPSPPAPTPTQDPIPTPNPPATSPIERVAFDYVQQVNHVAYRGGQVQSDAFNNASGAFRLPLAGQNLSGNITLSVDLQDPDGIDNVHVGFSGASSALLLCASNCGSSFHRTVTGINPLKFNLSDGNQRLELWVQDSQGNRTFESTVEFFWQPNRISGFNFSRSAGNIQLNWDSLGNYLRYNVYFAAQAGVSPSNYQTLAEGQGFLALRNANHNISGKQDSKVFFATVTGVDGSGESAFAETKQISAMSGAIDNPPAGVNDDFFVDEDTQLSGNLLANDSDDESSTLTLDTNPVHAVKNGVLQLNANGSFSYTPKADFFGRDDFEYRVFDGVGQSDTAMVLITINAVNDAPQSLDNHFNNVATQQVNGSSSFNARAGAPLSVAAPGLLINDLDIDSDTLTLITTPVSGPNKGEALLNADGSFVYTANTGASGQDQFTYQASDGAGGIAQATVQIAIDSSSFPPVASIDRYQLSEDQAFSANNSSTSRLAVTANDTDLDANDSMTVSLIQDVKHGVLTLATDGTFSYIPDQGYYGVDSFVYQITDNQNNTAQAGVKLNIARSNNPPTASDDQYNLAEDTQLTVSASNGILINDSDVDLDPITLDTTPVQAPAHGVLSLNANGSFEYQPNANYFGSDSFRYRITDDIGASAEGTVNLQISNVNDNPTANDDTVQTLIDTPITIAVLTNDSDIENEALSITSASANVGSVAINSDNTLTYTPANGFSGDDQIDYTIADTAGGSASAKVFVNVNNGNDAPIAVADSYNLNEDQTLQVNGSNQPLLTANDSDPDNNPLTVNTTPVRNPTNGTLTLANNGSFSYQPNSNFFGNDSFIYEINDGQGAAASAEVTLTVAPVNDPPVANNDNFATAEETLLNLNVLVNDSDIENDSLTVTSASANHGSAIINGDSSIDYTPNLNFTGEDQLSYSISDGNGGSAQAIATITVQNINDAPIAVDDNANTVEDQSVTINVLANDSDIDGDQISVLTATATNGGVQINSDNTLLYTPASNFNGTDLIDYVISDGNGGTATARVTVQVSATNDGPIALNDTAITDEDTPVSINVLANDSDTDGDLLSVTSASANQGTVNINSDNSLQYQPNAQFNGTDTIDYAISDGNGGTATANVSVTINAVNDAPVANSDIAVTDEDTSVIVNVLANDSDIDGDPLSVQTATANNGSVQINSNNTLLYTPTINFNGTDLISYVISDGNGDTAEATVTVQINAINDAPIAVNDTTITDEDTVVNINVLSNDSDSDGDLLSVTSASASQGTVNINSDNNLQYQPQANHNGSDVISYLISDGNGGEATGVVAVQINAINDAPVANDDSIDVDEDNAITIDILANDTDVDDDTLSTQSATASNGVVTINSNSSLSYTPNANFNGSDSISYVINDPQGATASANVVVTVLAVNDSPEAVSDLATTNEDTEVNIRVLANDSDIDSANLTVTAASANQGIVTIALDQSLNYAPNRNFNGADTINYTISDNDGGSASSTVAVTVSAVNDAPTAIDDTSSVDEDNSVNIVVLANDGDVDGDSLSVTKATAQQGTVLIRQDATLDYTPNPNFNGQDVLSYTISDNHGGAASAKVTITVNAINDLPVAVNDTAQTNEDVSVDINVLINDSDPDLDLLAISSATANQGSVSVNSDQSLRYLPNANFNGSDSIAYSVTDNHGGTTSATVAVTIIAVNDNPVAIVDNIGISEDTTVGLDVLANDTDVDGDPLFITSASASNGTVALVGNQSLIYAPNPNYHGAEVINYQISDNQGGSATSFVALDIASVNDIPVAQPDNATTNEDTAVSINVIINDSDVDGDFLTITAANANHGSVQIQPDRSLLYTPNANFNGEDVINYTINDGQGATASTTVSIIVNSVNDAPVALADSFTLDEDTSGTIAVLTNDIDVDGDPLTVVSATATHGSTQIEPNGSIAYTPVANFNGSDQISYVISDNQATATTTVAITVTAINDIPIAVNDDLTSAEDAAVNILVLSNDSDADGDSLTIQSANTTQGSVTIASNGQSLDYVPTLNFNGNVSISYTISDGHDSTAAALVNLTITAVNDNPVAVADSLEINEDTSGTVNVLANDTDVEGDTILLTTASVSGTNGSLEINPDKTLTYIPHANFNGIDTINYTIEDGNGGTANGTATVTVLSVNDLPVANPDTQSSPEDERAIVNVLANDTDIDGDTLTVSNVTANTGTVSIRTDNRLDYLPNIDYNGTVTINYDISDGHGGTASSTATLTITPVNDPPTAVADTASTSQNATININVLSNDTDPENDLLDITAATAVNGSVSITTGPSLQYTANGTFSGVDTINYTISDGQGGVASSTVTVSVSQTPNNSPVANADTATTNEDALVNINVLANDTDSDSDTLSVTAAIAINGVVTIKTDNTLDFVPNSNYNGAASISYDISDGRGGTASAGVSITVVAVNDAPTLTDASASIAENSANSTNVVTMTGSDIDTGDTLSYSIVAGNTDSVFDINATSGQITVVNNSFLNFESTTQYLLTVRVQDSGGLNTSSTATINVTNVEENATPTLDTSFGSSGTIGSNAFAAKKSDDPRSAILQSGKVLVVGGNDPTSSDMTLSRFNTDGTIDRSFGYNGVTHLDLGSSEVGQAVAIDSSGKIIVAGTYSFSTSNYVFTARFSADGMLDTSYNFGLGYHIYAEASTMTATDMKIHSNGEILIAAKGNDNFILVKFSADGASHTNVEVDFAGGLDIPTAIELTSDGKAVLIGSAFSNTTGLDFAAARFDITPSFALDTSYGTAGKVQYDLGNSLNDAPTAAVINASNEIVLAGGTVGSNSRTDLAAIKIDASGALVAGFANNGKLVVDLDGDGGIGSNNSLATAVTTDSGGNLYFGGVTGLTSFDSVIMKTDSLGTIATSYGNAGKVVFDLNTSSNLLTDLLIDSSDKAVMLTTTTRVVNPDIVVARFTTTGAVDTSFNSDGHNILDASYTVDVLEELIELTVAPNAGKFVAVGSAGNNTLAVARYTANGALDETFGSNGYYLLQGITSSYLGKDIMELSDGRLVIAGQQDSKGLVVMLTSSGVADASFGSNGLKTHISGSNLIFNAITLDSNTKIVVAGIVQNNSKDVFAMRMDNSGNADTSFGGDGTVTIDLLADEEIYDIAASSGGAIVGVGSKISNGFIVKLLNNGSLDTSGFASPNGYLTVDLDPLASVNVDTLRRVKIKSNGKIIAAGYTTDSQPSNALLQINSNGSVDTSFDNDGVVSHNYGTGGAKTLGLDLDSSEQILITGFNSNGTDDDIFVARVTATGAKDTLFNGSSGGMLFNYNSAELATTIKVRSDGTLMIAGGDNLNLFPTDFFFLQKIKLVEP